MTIGEPFGRYRLLERVGRGGMGVLYRAEDPVLGREVAIKMMSGDLAGDDDQSRERFFREARAAARLQHRNIVTVFEFAEEDGVPFIVMEYLHGRPLSRRMQEEPRLTLDDSLDIVAQLLTGLHYAHAHGVVHRDVKPANIWLTADGTVKLLDFGIARLTSTASGLTQVGAVVGSAEYMAPEQIAGTPVDGRADVFSAAVVLYELVSGRKPFESESPTSTLLKVLHEDPPALDVIAAHVPTAVADAIGKGLQKDPDSRFPDADIFAAELQLLRLSMQGSGETIFGDFATTHVGRAAAESTPPRVEARAAAPVPATPRHHTPRWRLSAGAGPTAVVLAAVLVVTVAGIGSARWWRGHSVVAEGASRVPAAAPSPSLSLSPTAAPPGTTTAALPPLRPALRVDRGRYFEYALPAGWRASETANGVDLTDPGGQTLVSFALLMNAPGQTSASAFLTRILAAIGATDVAIDALRPQDAIAATGGGTWQRVTAELRYQRAACACRAGAGVALLQGATSYSALISLYQVPGADWDTDHLWLAQMGDAISMIRTPERAALEQVQMPRHAAADGIVGRYQSLWLARGVPAERITQAPRDAAIGYEDMQSPISRERFRMPLETYDPAVRGYHNPDPLKRDEVLVPAPSLQ